jgi:hypothetical protein
VENEKGGSTQSRPNLTNHHYKEPAQITQTMDFDYGVNTPARGEGRGARGEGRGVRVKGEGRVKGGYNFSGLASNWATRASKRPAAPPSSTR